MTQTCINYSHQTERLLWALTPTLTYKFNKGPIMAIVPFKNTNED